MRISKILTGSMIAGAALLVSACGGGADEANNTAMTDMNATDTMMDGTTNDVTAIDAGTGADANMTMDANMTGTDMNATGGNTTTTTTTTDANMTNGM
jgi:hypothetical protein